MNILTLEEVAHRLSISYTAVRELILHDEAIPHFRVGSRGVRVKEEDLNAYIAKIEQNQEKEEVPDTRKVYEGRQILSKEGDK